jgi:predicted DNA-binding transcriptional regulator YafY
MGRHSNKREGIALERTERFYKIGQLLRGRKWVGKDTLLASLEISPATLKRDLRYMRDRMHAPIEWSREHAGYRLAERDIAGHQPHELPGLWFTPQEILALLTLQHWASSQDASALLAQHLAPLTKRLDSILGASPGQQTELKNRVRIIGLGQRAIKPQHFQQIGAALMHRQRLYIAYHARGSDQVTEREVSPQRLVHYRDNWYLDAWCHLRQDLRCFSVDAISAATPVNQAAKNISDKRLDAVLGAGYGIFSGANVRWARLLFTAERARWAAGQAWHPKQKAKFLPDGRYELRLPYADVRELMMDILKHGSHCQVLEPAELRDAVAQEAQLAAQQYFSNRNLAGSRGEPSGAHNST